MKHEHPKTHSVNPGKPRTKLQLLPQAANAFLRPHAPAAGGSPPVAVMSDPQVTHTARSTTCEPEPQLFSRACGQDYGLGLGLPYAALLQLFVLGLGLAFGA